ncbi:hypothetical protein [Rhizobium sp. BR 315]|uniref:hypothetical protein n=1 Tax=Rhizobium sp. BR 315 TaxID=3040014 RepID=UPI003D32EE6A
MAIFDAHVRKRRIVLLLGALVGIPSLATLVIAAIIVFSSISPMIWNSWSTHADLLAQEQARGARVEKAAQEETFTTLCSAYFEASFFDRWLRYRDRHLCEAFRNGMPGRS